MKNFKKTLALFLAVVLVLGVFAGCGKTEEQPAAPTEAPAVSGDTPAAPTEAPVVEEKDHSPITYTIAGSGNAENIWSETHQFQWYEENFGITFDGGVVSEFTTKLQLWLADDDLPDVMTGWSGFSRSQFSEWAEEGYFLNLADYLDIMPNFAAFLEAHPDYKNFVTLEDGGIYGLARYNNNPANGLFTPTYIRKDLLDQAGLEIPTSIDELYDVLVKFKEMGVEYPFEYTPTPGTGGAGTAVEWLALCFGMENGSIGDSTVRWMVEDGTVTPAIITENYKDYVKYLAKLYSEGLIAKEAFSLTAEQHDAIMTEGKFGVARGYQSLPGTSEEKIQNFAILPALTSEYVDAPTQTLSQRLTAEFFFMVSSKIENPERICELIDYCFTIDGYNVARWGVEGKSYDILTIGEAQLVDATKYEAEYAEKGVTNFDAIRRSFDTFSIIDFAWGGSFAAMAACTDDSTLLVPELIEIAGQNILRQKMINDNKELVLVDAYPATSGNITDNDTYSTIVTDICTYVNAIQAEFIVGSKDIDAYWDEFIQTLEQMGIQTLIDMEQAAYDATVGK